MWPIIRKISFIIVGIGVLGLITSNAAYLGDQALVLFATGRIHGTAISVSPDQMLALCALLIGFTMSRCLTALAAKASRRLTAVPHPIVVPTR